MSELQENFKYAFPSAAGIFFIIHNFQVAACQQQAPDGLIAAVQLVVYNLLIDGRLESTALD